MTFAHPTVESGATAHGASRMGEALALSNLGYPRRSFVEIWGPGIDSAVGIEALGERPVSSAHDFWQVRLGWITLRDERWN